MGDFSNKTTQEPKSGIALESQITSQEFALANAQQRGILTAGQITYDPTTHLTQPQLEAISPIRLANAVANISSRAEDFVIHTGSTATAYRIRHVTQNITVLKNKAYSASPAPADFLTNASFPAVKVDNTIATGTIIRFRPNLTNTTPTTLQLFNNPDGTGLVGTSTFPIVDPQGVAITAGYLKTNADYLFKFTGTNWQVIQTEVASISTGITAGTIPINGTASATETIAGIAEIATQAEVTTGTVDTHILSPLKAQTAFLRKDGSTTGNYFATGTIYAGDGTTNQIIRNVANPVQNQDAVTLSFLNAQLGNIGLRKFAVNNATLVAGVPSYISGTGATATITANATNPLILTSADGITRVFTTNQTATADATNNLKRIIWEGGAYGSAVTDTFVAIGNNVTQGIGTTPPTGGASGDYYVQYNTLETWKNIAGVWTKFRWVDLGEGIRAAGAWTSLVSYAFNGKTVFSGGTIAINANSTFTTNINLRLNYLCNLQAVYNTITGSGNTAILPNGSGGYNLNQGVFAGTGSGYGSSIWVNQANPFQLRLITGAIGIWHSPSEVNRFFTGGSLFAIIERTY